MFCGFLKNFLFFLFFYFKTVFFLLFWLVSIRPDSTLNFYTLLPLFLLFPQLPPSPLISFFQDSNQVFSFKILIKVLFTFNTISSFFFSKIQSKIIFLKCKFKLFLYVSQFFFRKLQKTFKIPLKHP